MFQITNEFELQSAQNEIAALMQQSLAINAQRIGQLQQAINEYLMKR
jgi:hypothetical protein